MKIHETIPNLKYCEKIPIPGNSRVVVDYEHLLTLEGLNKKKFIPEGLKYEINVKPLLDEIETKEQRMRKKKKEKNNTMPNGKEDEIEKSHNNPWKAGSFYIFIFVIIISTFTIVTQYVDLYAVPLIIMGGLLTIPIIGIFQSLNDRTLSEKGFLKVIIESYKHVTLIKRGNNAKTKKGKKER